MNIHSPKFKALAALFLFVLLEYIFNEQVEALGSYALYALEIALFAVFFFWVRGVQLHIKGPDKKLWLGFGVLAILGFVVRALSGPFGMLVPFDLGSLETIVMLLLVGPAIEEMVFRGVIQGSVLKLIPNPGLAGAVSALAFSYAHFQSLFILPSEFHSFVIYQTAYTFFLGVGLSAICFRHGLAWSILAHIIFNLGFFIAGWT